MVVSFLHLKNSACSIYKFFFCFQNFFNLIQSFLGARALREIRYYQKTTMPLILKGPFVRIVREIAADRNPEIRFQETAFRAVQVLFSI